jgi:hypothetical protein
MRKFVILLCLLAAIPALAQDAKSEAKDTRPEARFYHLGFVVKELDGQGKVVNTRSFRTDISTTGLSSLRTGTKIPVHAGTTKDKDDEIQYIDLGVNIDTNRAQETPQGLALEIKAEVSSLAGSSAASDASLPPVIRQNRWSSFTVLPIAKPVVVFSSDNVEGKGRMEVEVTATPIP